MGLLGEGWGLLGEEWGLWVRDGGYWVRDGPDVKYGSSGSGPTWIKCVPRDFEFEKSN